VSLFKEFDASESDSRHQLMGAETLRSTHAQDALKDAVRDHIESSLKTKTIKFGAVSCNE
jgi:hypothetical protein